MKAVLLNSGVGSRMGHYTENSPKCLVRLSDQETILSRQIRLLSTNGISEFVITTGPYGNMIPNYVKEQFPNLNVQYVVNPDYQTTNYIYSMYLAKNEIIDDIFLLHGDLVFEKAVLTDLLQDSRRNLGTIDSTAKLPDKDFICRIEGKKITEIGVTLDRDENTRFFLPFYKLNKSFMNSWMEEIGRFVKEGNTKVYAENAFNTISRKLHLEAYDKNGKFCMEIDTIEDLLCAEEVLK